MTSLLIHYWRSDDTPADRTACGLGVPGLAAHNYSPVATTSLAEDVTCPNCKQWLTRTGMAAAAAAESDAPVIVTAGGI